jgi:pilin isopeptide linkage protein
VDQSGSDTGAQSAAAAVDESGSDAQTPDNGDSTASASAATGETGDAQTTSVKRSSVRRAAAADSANEKDLAPYINSKSTLEFYVDGKWWSLDDLNAAGKQVPVGTSVKVKLYFNEIDSIPEDCVLYYQLPEDTINIELASSDTLVDGRYGVDIGTYTIDTDGRITVNISSSYFNKYKHTTDDTLDLQEFNISFSGSLSDDLGQDSTKNDNKITFTDSASGGPVTITIPFDYANEKGKIVVEKTGTADLTEKTVHYVVTVTAPSENTLTSEGVTVTDKFGSGSQFIELYDVDKTTSVIYRNVTATQTAGSSTLSPSFDATTGVLTIGDMAAGDVVTLEYDVKLAKDFYEGANVDLANYATAVYNGNGKAVDDDVQVAPGTVIVDKEPGDADGGSKTMLTDENGDSYLVYTVKVTAYNGDAQNVSVVDTFTQNASAIARYGYDTPSVGTVTTVDKSDSGNASLTWKVGSLGDGESATLTYRAYLDADAWNANATNNGYSVFRTLNLVNTATAMLGDTSVDKDTTTTQITKTLVVKSASQAKDSSIITYTVKANSYPSTSKVTTITDTITSTGTATYGENLTLRVYEYDASGNKTYTDYTVPLSSVKTGDKSFTIELANVTLADGSQVDLTGPYYYEVTYTVDAGTSLAVSNGAGIGIVDGGKTYSYTHSVTTNNAAAAFKASKEIIDADIGNETITFRAKLTSDSTANLPAGSIFYDELYSAFPNFWWFTADEVAQTKVMLGDTDITDQVTIEPYYVRVVDGNSTASGYSNGKYIGFKVTFNSAVSGIDANNPVTVVYKVHFNQYSKQSETNKTVGNTGPYMHNKAMWKIGDETQTVPDYSLTYAVNWPIEKTGTGEGLGYDPDTNTITWSIVANRQGNIEGDAVITETIPAGQTFVVSDVGDTEEERLINSIDLSLNTYGDVTSTGSIQKVEVDWPEDPDTEETVVRIYLTGLTGYIYNQYRNEDGTLNAKGVTLVKGSGWTPAEWRNYGWVTLKLQTALTEKAKKELDENTELTNSVTLSSDSLKEDYDSTASVKPGISTIVKAMSDRDFPAYVQFTLDVNQEAMNLDPDQDTVTIYDQMSEGLTIAPEHANYLKVYDMTGAGGDIANATLLTAGDGADNYSITIGEDSSYFELTVPDGKYIKVVYWSKFAGAAGEEVALNNTADFYYEGVVSDDSQRAWSSALQVQSSDASAWSNPYVYLYKYDQNGDALDGVTFELRTVTDNGDGTVSLGSTVTTMETDETGTLYFGHRGSDNYSLDHDVIYAVVETAAPAGYALAEPYYFEFPDIYDEVQEDGTTTYVVNADKQAAHEATHPTNVTVHDVQPGETIGIMDEVSIPTYALPLDKTINGSHVASGTDFTFTLKAVAAADGTANYDSWLSKINEVDGAYTKTATADELIADGITVTNDGSDVVYFDDLYFPGAGIYEFTLSENDTDAKGFTKDATVYTVFVSVGLDGLTNELNIGNIYFYVDGTEVGRINSDGSGDGYVPTFNNLFSLTGSFEVTLQKAITNWPEGVDMPAFQFEVYRNGEKLEGVSNSDEGTITNAADGSITFSIPISDADMGTDQRFVIKEVSGDSDLFTYDTDSVVLSADITTDENGDLTGTNIAFKTKDGTFTNEYHAEGTIDLTGTKYLFGPDNVAGTVQKDQFSFTVQEGNTEVATGTTNSDGSITFTTINYVATQMGEHTYTITENKGHELFQNYDAAPATVVVTVADDGTGTGKLTAEVTSVNGVEGADITFTNTCTYLVPTGVHLELLPYVLLLCIGLCGGAALVVHSRKRKQHSGE